MTTLRDWPDVLATHVSLMGASQHTSQGCGGGWRWLQRARRARAARRAHHVWDALLTVCAYKFVRHWTPADLRRTGVVSDGKLRRCLAAWSQSRFQIPEDIVCTAIVVLIAASVQTYHAPAFHLVEGGQDHIQAHMPLLGRQVISGPWQQLVEVARDAIS